MNRINNCTQYNSTYRVAKYLRLSRDDGDNRESESIENQRDIINNYINEHNELESYEEYIDDGYTGTNFNRPGFKQMIQDLEQRKNRLHYNERSFTIWSRPHRYRILP